MLQLKQKTLNIFFKVHLHKFFPSLLFLLYLQCAYGQSPVEKLATIVKPSPEAASISRYGIYPVSMFTGLPNISIPIYTLNVKNFSLPISLSYHASGIKVDDIASWVGLGWNLNAGGVITRVVMGIPDESRYQDIFTGSVKRADQISTSDFNYLLNILNLTVDSEPDLFYYSFGGKSGKFVLGGNKKALTTPHDNLQINFDDKNNKFSITDTDGKVYFFEKTATNSSVTGAGVNYVNATTSWYLTKIELENKADSIIFSYSDYNPGNIQTINYWLTLGRISNGSDVSYKDYTEPTKTDTYENPITVYLKEIKFPNGKIRFVPKNRLDFGPAASLLDSVIVENNSKVIQRTALVHDYFYSDDGYNPYASPYDKYRLKLTELRQMGGDNILKYRFEYEEQYKLPPRKNFGIDWWGYSNGSSNNKTSMPLNEFGKQYTNNHYVNYLPSTIIDPGVRIPNEENMKAGMLKRIYYPTGGYTDFDFEANRVASTKSIETPPYGTVNVSAKKDDRPDDPERIKEFISPINAPPASTNVPNRAYLTVSVPLWNDKNQPFALFENLTKGTYLKLTTNPGEQTFRTIYVDLSKGDKCRLTASIKPNPNDPNDNPDQSVLLSLTYPAPDPITVVPDIQIGPGLRVKSIKSYNPDGKEAKQEDYKYGENESGLGSPSFFNYLFNTETQGRSYTQKYRHYSGPKDPASDYDYVLEISSKPFFSYSDFGGSAIAYPTVTKYEQSDGGDNGKTVYQYDLELDDKIDYKIPDPQLLISSGWKSGNLLSEKKYKRVANNTYKLIEENSNQYQLFSFNTNYGLKVKRAFTDMAGKYEEANDVHTITDLQTVFNYFEYPIMSGVKKIIKNSKTLYSDIGASPVTETVTYTYNDTVHLLPSVIETDNSKGSTLKQSYLYPFDKTSLSGLTPQESVAIDTLLNRNMIEKTLEEAHYNNNTLVKRSHLEYNLWSPPYLIPDVKKLRVKNSSFNEEDRYEISNYSNGNIMEQAKSNGVKEVYLWGYNSQYPVVKVIGSDYNTIKAFVNQAILDNPATTDVAMRAELNKIRIGLASAKAQVTTYTYSPLVGMTSMTDAKGETTTYEYDGFQRLMNVKDKDGNIVKHMDYHYQGQ